jgi:hypothetical protein
MTRSTSVPLFVLAAALLAPVVAAAEFTPRVAESAPVSRPAESPALSRPLSPAVAALLTISAPRYSPPPAAPSPSPDVAPDARDTDKPRNGIIRLPSYLVQEEKLPVLKQRDILTPHGRLELALKRHPGLRFGSFGPLNNNVWANALLEEEFGIERSAEMASLLGLTPGKHEPFVIAGRPPFSIPYAASGPWAGLVVPWERR